jgi:integrase
MASIRKIEKTGRWYAQIYLGKHPDTGKHRFVSKTFGKGKQSEAKEWAKKLEVDRDEGLYQPTLTKATFASYLTDVWLPMHRKQVRSTYTVETILRKWIFTPQPGTPFLGAKPLRKLTVGDFDKLYLAMEEKGLQRRSIEHLHGVLKRALKSAVRKGELPRNPADFATLPKPNVTAEITCSADEDEMGEVEYLSQDQAVRFLAAADKTRLAALWHLLIDSGLRPGEAFALKWEHIDIERKLVRVRGTLARVRGEARLDRGKGWMITRPKTESSIGDVPVRAETIKQLVLWRKQQAAERAHAKANGLDWQEHGFVFTTEFGTPLGNNMANAWTRVLKMADGGKGDLGTWGPEPTKPKAGPTAERSFTPRFSPYVLRHTMASLLILGGMSLLEVSRRLRHKNTAVADRHYVRVKAHDTTQAAEIFDRILERRLTLVA